MSKTRLTAISRRTLLGGASLLALGVLAPGAARADVRARRMRLGHHDATTRFVLELSDRVVWRTFTLDAPPRLVIDLSQADFRDAAAPGPAGVVKAVRTGPGEAGLSRVVIDLAGPALVDKDFLLEPQESFGWRLVLDIVKVERSAFVATVGRVPPPVAPAALTPDPSTRAAGLAQEAAPAPAPALAPAQGYFPSPGSAASPPSVLARPTPTPAAMPAAMPVAMTVPETGSGGGPVDLRPAAAGAPVRPTRPVPVFDPGLEPAPDPEASRSAARSARSAASASAPMASRAPTPEPDIPEASSDGPVMVRLADGQRVPVPGRKPSPAPTLAAAPARRPTIVLDPGHGGRDPGAISPSGGYEKDLTLAMGRELRRVLESTGRYRVVMTRSDDRQIALRDRIALGRQAEGDLFISLHADAMHDPSVRGLSVYTLSETASDAEAAALAERENKVDILLNADLSNQSPDVANILIDLAQRATMNNSALFANTLIRNLPGDFRKLVKPHRSAGFAVLKAPDMPSVLLEMGFLSNQADENLLRTQSYRSKLADAIVRSIDDYTVLQQQRAGRP